MLFSLLFLRSKTYELLDLYEPGANLMGPVKNQCVQLSNGDVLCPSSNESEAMDTAHFETTNVEVRYYD